MSEAATGGVTGLFLFPSDLLQLQAARQKIKYVKVYLVKAFTHFCHFSFIQNILDVAL
jgi:hypothetical protein